MTHMMIPASNNRHMCVWCFQIHRDVPYDSRLKTKDSIPNCTGFLFHSKNNKRTENLFYSFILVWSHNWQGSTPYKVLFYLGRGDLLFLLLLLFFGVYILIHSWKQENTFFPLCISSQVVSLCVPELLSFLFITSINRLTFVPSDESINKTKQSHSLMIE